jgi:hypothetical protein
MLQRSQRRQGARTSECSKHASRRLKKKESIGQPLTAFDTTLIEDDEDNFPTHPTVSEITQMMTSITQI